MQLIFWFASLVLAAGAGYLVYRADKKRAVPYPFATAALRTVVVFLALLLVLAPSFVIDKNTVEKPVVVLLQDNSTSVGRVLGLDSAKYTGCVKALLDRLNGKFEVDIQGFSGKMHSDDVFKYDGTSTNIAGALTAVKDYYGNRNLGAIILASDGRYNAGANPLFDHTGLNCPVYTIGIGDTAVQKDLAITQTLYNKTVAANSSFEIRVGVAASLCGGFSGNLSVLEDGRSLATLPLNINNDRFDHEYVFSLRTDKTGLHHYRILLPTVQGEANTANNIRDIYVDVTEEKKSILIAAYAPHPDVYAIREALSGLDAYKVTVCSADNLPGNFSAYSAIILHGLPNLKKNITSALIAAKKPLWVILTDHTDYQTVGDLNHLTGVRLGPGTLHNLTPIYNPAFVAFTVPGNIQSILDKMPPLTTNVGGLYPLPGSYPLLEQKTGFADTKTSVWLLQQAEVPSAYLAGEGIWRWRLQEFKNNGNHDVIDELIRQTVTFLCTDRGMKPFSVKMTQTTWTDAEPVNLQAFLYNENKESTNTPDADLSIADSSGKVVKYTFERVGSAYALNLGIHAPGTYTYTARTGLDGKDYKVTGSFAVTGTPLELLDTRADFELLSGLSKIYGGEFFSANSFNALADSLLRSDSVKPVIRTTTETVQLIDRKWYFFLILLVATGEWLLRKYWMAQ